MLTGHLSERTPQKTTLLLYGPGTAGLLFETQLEGPFEAGLQRIRLADHGVRLEPGLVYDWIVQVGSGSQLAQGQVRRVYPSAELRKQLAEASEADRPLVLAGSGVWYDALEAFSRRVDAAPDDGVRRAERRALLESAGLDPALAD